MGDTILRPGRSLPGRPGFYIRRDCGDKRQVDEETAKGINEIFVEIVVAPCYTDGALEILKGKKNIES